MTGREINRMVAMIQIVGSEKNKGGERKNGSG